jgi:lipopolysaccharide transport protein LptA
VIYSVFDLSFGLIGNILSPVIGGFMQQFQLVTLKISRIVPLWTIALIITAALITGAAFAADTSKAETSDAKPENTPIIITAEQLDSDNKAKFAEFIGNVKAIQADFVITSDKLRIYYKGELLDTEKKGNDEDALKKIVATGNVKITSDQYIAKTEKLEYDTASMTIILTGENSTVINGKNSITGSKIILYQKDGRVKVLGSKNKRIKAEFYSKGETSDAFKLGKPKK